MAPDVCPEHDPALRDRLSRLLGVLRRAALARTRPVRHTRGYLAELRLVEVGDQAAVRRPRPPDGASRGERSDGGGYRRERNDGGGYRGERNDGGGYRGERNDGGGYRGERSDGGGYRGERSDGGGYRGERSDGGGYRAADREVLRVGRDPTHAATFDALFDLHRLAADAPETVELVLAAGLLHAPGTPEVHVHLITQAVRVDRDAATGEMVVAVTADRVTVEDDEVLGGTDLLDLRAAAGERERLAASLASALDPALTGLLAAWGRRCLRHPHEIGDDWIAPTDDHTRLVPAPALVARRRGAAALRTFYDHVAADVTDPARPLPVGLAQLVIAIEPAEREAWLARAGHGHPPVAPLAPAHPPVAPLAPADSPAEPLVADPLFPLPVGRAQARILTRLGRDSGVVVEGPPGTGKTHTIANLVAALLAEGRRVLVTSEKAQALRVLRDMLPVGLRDLCVSLAEPEAAGDDLGASVTRLASAATEFDPDGAARRIDELTARRAALVAERDRVLDAVVAACEAESTTYPEIAPGYEGTRAEIARQVRANAVRDGWLADLVDPSRVLPRDPPCTPADLAALVERGPAGDDRADQWFPPPSELPPESHVADLAAAHGRGAAASSGDRGRLAAPLGALPAAAAHHLPGVCRRLGDAIVELSDTGEDHDWAREAADAVLSGRASHPWSRAVEQLVAVDDLVEHDRRAGAAPVRVPETVDPAAAAPVAERLAAWLEDGHAPRRVFKDPAQREFESVLGAVEVHGGALATPAGARTAAHHLRMLEITDRLAAVFAPLAYPLRRAEHRALLVEQALRLRATCVQVGAVLTAAGQLRAVLAALPAAHRPRVDSLAVLEAAATVGSDVEQIRCAERAGAELTELVRRVTGGLPTARWAPEVRRVADALTRADPQAYTEAVAALDDARAEQRDRGRAERVATRLAAVVPGLTAALDEPVDWPARARRWHEAWAHARAASWLGRRDTSDPDPDADPGARLADLDAELTAVTTDLATARAWRACLARTTAEQARALQSHRAATAAIGRGAGRYADHYRRAARDAVRAAREAVPAWVMPIREVLDAVEPRRDAFDVVVVDEASQADLTSLFLLWLAPRVIVVGDDRQCSPSEVGISSLEPAFARLESDLPDVPTYLRSHFTPRSSVFSVFRTTFGPPIRLREHFRSMPEIIDFSSREFYAGPGDGPGGTAGAALVPLRRFGADRLPPLRSTFVPGATTRGSGGGLSGPDEAGALVDAVAACDVDPAYDGATFGVVVLQGHGQVELIDALLRERLDPARWEARRLRVGVPADFQGDERTVVWLSMVVAPGHRLVALTAERFRQGFNVAASRARDQMWLFHAVTVDELARTDLRRRLLEHVTDPPDPVGSTAARPARSVGRDPAFPTRFAQRVHAELSAHGFAVAPGVEVNGRRLDLVVTGVGGRLAVLCDAVERAVPLTRDDVEREQELRRFGWPVARVRESDHVIDPDGVLYGLLADLDAAGITPTTGRVALGVADTAPAPGPDGHRRRYVPSDADPGALDRLVVELAEAGLPAPRRDAEVHDPLGGALLCTADALWPTGITRHALAAPVVLVEEIDGGFDALARLRKLGYLVFTAVADVRAHVLPD